MAGHSSLLHKASAEWFHWDWKIHFHDGCKWEITQGCQRPQFLSVGLSTELLRLPLSLTTGFPEFMIQEDWTEAGRLFFPHIALSPGGSVPLHSAGEACHKSQHRFQGRTTKSHLSLGEVVKNLCSSWIYHTHEVIIVITTTLWAVTIFNHSWTKHRAQDSFSFLKSSQEHKTNIYFWCLDRTCIIFINSLLPKACFPKSL